MNRLEALKAMLDSKKVGHPKAAYGTYYVLEERRHPIRLKQEYSHEDSSGEMTFDDDGYYIIKNKVKKYKVLYRIKGEEDLMISSDYYYDLMDFRSKYERLEVLQILESTMIEVEEE